MGKRFSFLFNSDYLVPVGIVLVASIILSMIHSRQGRISAIFAIAAVIAIAAIIDNHKHRLANTSIGFLAVLAWACLRHAVVFTFVFPLKLGHVIWQRDIKTRSHSVDAGVIVLLSAIGIGAILIFVSALS